MNNAAHRHDQTRGHARAGFSLVEILVVLVVLVVGILAIVRLFPAGFIALRNAQNSTFADRLGQAALESLKQGQGTLPDAVYMYTDEGFDPSVTPDDLYSYVPETGTNTGKNTSREYGLLSSPYADINKQRYISNETVSVPAAHAVGGTLYPPLYAVAFGPISLPATALPAAGASLPLLTVNSAPWAQQNGDSRLDPGDPNAASNPAIARHYTNPADILSPSQQAYLADLAGGVTPTPVLRPTQTLFLVDKDMGQIAVPTASYAQTFVLTVTRKYSGTTTQTITADALGFSNNAPTGYNGNWFGTTIATGGGDPLPSTAPVLVNAVLTPNPWTEVTLTRPFQYMGLLSATTFTDDPYEYSLSGDNIDPGVNMGVLAFSPKAGGQNGIAPLQAQISYQTLNWHVLHEDLNVPGGGGPLKLVLDHLKRVGDVQFDGTTFGGLAGGAGITQYDLMMVDRDTGAFYGLNVSKNYTATGTGLATPTPSVDIVDNGDTLNATDIQVNYAGGRIALPAAFAEKHLRLYYAGDADWAVAVQKAPSVYVPAMTLADLSTISPTPNRYFIPYTTNTGVDTTTGTRIYFPACDAGKTVELDNVTYDATNNNMPVTRSSNGTPQLAQVVFPISVAPATLGGTDYYVELGRFGLGGQPGADVIVRGNTDTTSDTNVTNLKFSSARGVSLRAVVIWRERNTWHTRATDTLLTRSR